ncbi:macrolide transporter [Niabella ginsenosidivorans]|uniref:Macrolide transporter n=1 Tax=Niabella ginsenosidivorans TaxID=1176587 RepID=A0A1A9I321_9BACT|nr:ABC transporter permease [Niabella ginsenosidivorans]ANH81459.1 macrolide transporter [Niabella ginsenosidivorans]
MIKNYLKIAFRNLKKYKLYTAINVLGLSVGIASCLLIGMYVWTECSYDVFNSKADRIVRVTMDYSTGGSGWKGALTGTKVGPQFKRTFPQVEDYVRLMKSAASIAAGATAFDEKKILYADKSFFRIFSFPLLTGNPETVLNGPQKIVLSRTMAKRYFGNENPVGKRLRFNGGENEYEVTGIAGDAPLNSQIQYDCIVSFSSLAASKTEYWNTANYVTYLLMKDADQFNSLSAGITAYMKKVNRDEMAIVPGSTDYWTYHLEPLKRVHLYSTVDAGLEPRGNITYVYILGGIALLILLIACVNYTNLATAQSSSRSIEIGVRKVLGAEKKQLIGQFIGESFLMAFISLLLALGICMLLLPVFNAITGKDYAVSGFFHLPVLLAALLLTVIIALVSAIYPAILLTRSRLTSILKNGATVAQSGGGLRKALIIVQFVVAVFLIAVTMIISSQVKYIQHTDLGYDREQVVVLPVDYKMSAVYEQLKDAFRTNPDVVSVTGAYEAPASIGWGDAITADDGSGPKELSVSATPVDLDYLKTMGIQLAAGRDFQRSDFALQDTSNEYKNYQSTYILNEKAVRDLGWTPQDAIGRKITRGEPGTVVGVVKDFHFESLHDRIGPLVIFLDTTMVRELFVKIRSKNMAGTITALSTIWKSRVPYRSFDYRFLDDDFNDLYVTEQRTATLFTTFAGIAIVLSCLGLFALAAFVTVQRTKEIGIRKVLGANEGNILLLITRRFLLLVIVAILIATPLAWLVGNSWLAGFAYRTQLHAWLFVVAGLVALLVAFCAVSYHALRAALANPVEALRTE